MGIQRVFQNCEGKCCCRCDYCASIGYYDRYYAKIPKPIACASQNNQSPLPASPFCPLLSSLLSLYPASGTVFTLEAEQTAFSLGTALFSGPSGIVLPTYFPSGGRTYGNYDSSYVPQKTKCKWSKFVSLGSAVNGEYTYNFYICIEYLQAQANVSSPPAESQVRLNYYAISTTPSLTTLQYIVLYQLEVFRSYHPADITNPNLCEDGYGIKDGDEPCRIPDTIDFAHYSRCTGGFDYTGDTFCNIPLGVGLPSLSTTHDSVSITTDPVAGGWNSCGSEATGTILTSSPNPYASASGSIPDGFATGGNVSIQSSAKNRTELNVVPRPTRCEFLSERIDFKAGCSGWRCLHKCLKGNPAVPGEYCQNECNSYKADDDYDLLGINGWIG